MLTFYETTAPDPRVELLLFIVHNLGYQMLHRSSCKPKLQYYAALFWERSLFRRCKFFKVTTGKGLHFGSPFLVHLNSREQKKEVLSLQISQSRYSHVVHMNNYCTNAQSMVPSLTTGAAHLPGDQILCGGNRIHILTGSSSQNAEGARSCWGPTAAVLYCWTAAPH